MHIFGVVLNNLISDYVTFHDLNYRINHFEYGRGIEGKPSEISYGRVKDKSGIMTKFLLYSIFCI